MPNLAYETLVVCPTNRGEAVVADLEASIAWSFDRPWHLLIVDDAGDVVRGSEGATRTVVPSSLLRDKRMSGFKAQEGIRVALERGDRFDAVLCIDDDALCIGRGVDTWALELIDRRAVDLLGVQDRVSYASQWPFWRPLFSQWAPEAAGLQPLPESVFYSAIWLSRNFVEDLYSREMLVPPAYEQWGLWPDVYISWACQATGHYQLCWGHMDAPRPPLFHDHPDNMRKAAAPWDLKSDYLLYHSTRGVPGHSEAEIRLRYAARRAAVPRTTHPE